MLPYKCRTIFTTSQNLIIALLPAIKCAKTSWQVIFGPNWTSVDGPKVKYKFNY